MKPHQTRNIIQITSLLLLSSALLAMTPGKVLADTITGTGWKGTTSVNWSAAGNWDSTAPATGGSGERSLFFGAVWNTAGRTGQIISSNDLSVATTGWNGYRVTFESIATATNFTLVGNSFTLFDFGSGTFPRIENDSATNQTFALTNGATIAFNDSQTTHEGQVNPVNGNLTFSSGTKIDLAGTTQLQIWGNNGKTVTFGGAISSSGNSGNNTVAINQNSIVIFGATNTYAGDTFINAGTLVLATNSATVANATAFIRLGDTAATGAGANLNLNGGNNVFTPVNVRAGSAGGKIIANTAGTAGAAFYGTNIYLDADVTLYANSGGGNVLAGSTLDLKNQTLTVDGPGTNYLTGPLQNSTGSGKLIKNGTGTLTLGGAATNTYAGATTVNAGELIGVTGGSCSNSAVTVVGATNGVLVASAGGQWAGGALTYSSGTTYADINFGANAPSATTAPLLVDGNLAFTVTPTILIRATATIPAGTYPLIKYTGTLSGTPPSIALTTLPGGTATLINNTANKSIDLSVSTVSWATGSGTWDINTTANWKNSSLTSVNYVEGEAVFFGDSLSGASPITVTLNSTVNPLSMTVSNAAKSYTVSGSGSIAGGVSLTKTGTGSLTLGNANTYTGGTVVNAGTVTLDFTASGAPASNIVSASSALTLGGGTLNINGNASANNAQTNASTSLNGANSITVTAPASRTETVNLNAIAQTAIGTTLSILPTGAGTVTVDGSAGSNVNAPANTPINSSTANYVSGCFVTYGTSDYAMISSGNLVVLGSGNYTANVGPNADVTGTGYTTPSTTTSLNCMRFNAAGSATVINRTVYTTGGILVTPTAGANNQYITSSGATHSLEPNRSNTSGSEAVIWQNNTSGYLVFAGANTLDNGKTGNANWVQAGPGTVQYNQNASTTNGFGGSMYLNGGYTLVSANGNGVFGPLATAATLNLNGGTVVAGTSFTLDNAGANPRPIALGNAGGGLAAAAGLTLTVDGIVGGAGPLTVGCGTLPGSGAAPNPTAVVGSGTVIFNSGGNNYSGVTTITGGATLNINSEWALGGANYGGLTFNNGTLQYASTLLNSTTDISAQPVSLVGNATIDMNGNTINFANAIGNSGSGALTVKSTAANGVLTLQGANTYTGGTTVSSGTLNVNNTFGSGTGSGSVTLNSGATLGGTGTISGGVTVSSSGVLDPGNGATVGTLTVGSLTLNSGATNNFEFNSTPTNDLVVVSTSGGLVLNGGSFNLYAAGGTTPWTTSGTYKLIQYSGSISGTSTSGGNLDSTWTTDSASNAHVANPQTGYTYHFSTSGGYLTVTITLGASVGTWAVNSDGNWSTAGNWTGAGPMPPSNPGDSATLGVGTAFRTVTLDANEAVGALTITNANSFAIATGGKVLTLDNKGVGATLTVSAGTSNVIQTAVALNDSITATVSSGKWLAISGIVSNSTGVTKTLAVNGAGTLALSGNNSYGPTTGGTAGTTLSGGGILQVGSAGALGFGDLTNAGSSTLQAGAAGLNITNNIGIAPGVTATVDNNGNNLTLSGIISGSGSASKISGGTLTLSGANSYSGGTVIGAGVVSVATDGAAAGNPGNLGAVPASATTNVIINGGDLLGNGTFSLHANRGLGIGATSGSATTTALIDAASGQTFTVGGTIASAGNTGVNNLTVNSVAGTPGTVILNGANTFSGTTVVSGGTLTLGNSLALQSSTLNYNNQGGALSFGSLTTATVGGLSGAQNLGITNTAGAAVALTAGGNNSSTTYSGLLSGSGSLSKVGTGTLTLGNPGYTGNTIVNSGGLIITNGTLTSHLDLSAQQGVVNAVISGGTVTSSSGLYITSPTGGSGSPIYGNAANLTITNGAQVTANADGNGRALSYGAASTASAGERPGGNGSLTVGTTGDITTLVTANGVLDMFATSGGGTVGNFTVNLNGGTLAVNRIQETTAASQSGTFKFNGGTLKALASDATSIFIPATPSAFTTPVYAGGAIIDADVYNITIGAVLAHGGGTPDGGLTKLGGGTLTLTNVNTYTGNTIIMSGTLALGGSGSIGASPLISVTNGATLNVSALSSTFVLGSGQTLSNNAASTGALNGNFNTGSGTGSISYAVGTSAFSIANGTLTLTASTTFNVNNTGAALAAGSYKLIEKSTGGTVAATTLPSVTVTGGGVTGTLATSLAIVSGELYLNVGVTTGTITSSLNPAGYLTTVSFTDTMSPTAATGTIQFLTNGTAFSANSLVSGVATSAGIGNLPRGTNTITVVYSGDTSYAPTTNLFEEVVTNHPPVAGNTNYNRSAGITSLKMNISDLLAANTTDADGDLLTISGLSVSTNGVTVTTNSGYIFYTNTNAVNDQFSYTVNDGYGGSATGLVTLTVSTLPVSGQMTGSITITGGTAALSFQAIPNYNYVIERTTSLSPEAWVDISTNTAAANGAINATDTFGDLGSAPAAAYYRLKWQP